MQGASKMMTIFSVLVFVLVQGRAVCDEVYPISLLEGFFVNQSKWHARDHTEPPQVKSKRPRPARFSQIDCSISISEANDVDWITKCIVDEYNFEANENENEWKSQPDFKDVLRTRGFKRKAEQVQTFFQRFRDWDEMKGIFQENTKLLMITAARYLLVTSILYTESSFPKLTPCSKSQEGKYVIPLKGVCYPAPYGSASYKSDYDVGLIGPDSGSLTERFNDYFQREFGKPSEFVFDTNVYAFTLEFAIPSMFINLPWSFQPQVTDDEKTDDLKIQELVSAYFKVSKYNKKFFDKLLERAWKTISNDPRKKRLMKYWFDEYVKMKMSLASFSDSRELREVHNKKYGEIVRSMSHENPTPYQPKFLGLLSKALIYAAEAYHTRGAIRHVVGAIQMEWIDESLRTSLSTNDLWVSMIENWGEANKEYNHCGVGTRTGSIFRHIKKCFLLMSKYMWRVLDAMRLLQERLPERYAEMVRFSPFIDPQCIMKIWLRYKKQGETNVQSNDMENVRVFLKGLGCKEADVMRGEFTLDCLEKMHDKVDLYNAILAQLFVLEPDKLLRK